MSHTLKARACLTPHTLTPHTLSHTSQETPSASLTPITYAYCQEFRVYGDLPRAFLGAAIVEVDLALIVRVLREMGG